MRLKIESHCKECGQDFDTMYNLAMHIRTKHKINVQDYYDKYYKRDNVGRCLICGKPTKFKTLSSGYAEYCSPDCANKANRLGHENKPITCAECGQVFHGDNISQTVNRLLAHTYKEHGLRSKDYYDKFMKKPDEGVCPVCGKETPYAKFSQGYRKYCSAKCQHADLDGTYKHIREKYNDMIEQEKKIVVDEQMIQERWQRECQRRLAEFEYTGQKGTMTYTDTGFDNFSFSPEVTFFDCF